MRPAAAPRGAKNGRFFKAFGTRADSEHAHFTSENFGIRWGFLSVLIAVQIAISENNVT